MCYEPTARPPLPPIAGGSGLAGSEEIILEAADGTRFSAFSTRTDEPGAPGVVILPDVRGLHPFYRDLAVRFAEAGAHATAMDYFGRTAGLGPRDPDDDYAPILLAPGYRCRVLGLFGGADQAIPTEEFDRFRQTLDAAGVGNEIVSYDGAPHSFFDRSAAQHREASDDAWRRMLAFIGPGGPSGA